MNKGLHLGINTVIVILLGLVLFYFRDINLLDYNIVYLVVTVYIFSNLPDIDHAKSKMTKTFSIPIEAPHILEW